jgi:hypothetical protein
MTQLRRRDNKESNDSEVYNISDNKTEIHLTSSQLCEEPWC